MANKYKTESRVDEARSCTRKRRYSNAQAARQAIIETGATRYYKCEYCDGWHITTQLRRWTGNKKREGIEVR